MVIFKIFFLKGNLVNRSDKSCFYAKKKINSDHLSGLSRIENVIKKLLEFVLFAIYSVFYSISSMNNSRGLLSGNFWDK